MKSKFNKLLYVYMCALSNCRFLLGARVLRLRGCFFIDHGDHLGNATDGSIGQPAPKVSVSTLPMGACQGILAVSDSET